MDANKHPTKCLRDACHIMGFELVSVQQFVMNATEWLAARGELTIAAEDGDYSAKVDGVASVFSIGSSLSEALCGAVHAIGVEMSDQHARDAGEGE